MKWKYLTGDLVQSSPAIGADGSIYIGSFDNNIYALTSSGTLKWKYLTGDGVYSSPAIGADGSIYFGGLSGYIYALTSSSGGPLPPLQEVGSLVNMADSHTSSSISMIILLTSVIASVCVLAALFMTYRFYHSYHKMKNINDRDFDIFSSSTNTDDEFDLNNPMHEEK